RLSRSAWQLDVSCLRAEGPLRARLEAAGVSAWSCGRGSFKSAGLLFATGALARHLRAHRVQLVHGFDFYSNILGVLAARLAHVPVIIASQRDLGDLRSPFQQRVHRAVLQLADYVLVNAQAVADRVASPRAASMGRVVVIPSGVDLARFAPVPHARSSGARVTVGTLANLRPEKALSDLLRAAVVVREQYPDVRFAVWGDGPDRSALEALRRDLALEEVIAFYGRTTNPEAVLREFDIFVLPSISEACPNAVLEAMASGVPVIATRVGGIPGLIEEEITGLMTSPADPLGLAKAIIRLIEQPSVAARLAARALDRVRREFSVASMVERVQSFYRLALN